MGHQSPKNAQPEHEDSENGIWTESLQPISGRTIVD